MDISKFTDSMESRCSVPLQKSRLTTIRENREISQAELARISGVSLRSIQMYEQRNKDINKASAEALYRIAKVLGCTMENLLEKQIG